MSFLGLAFEDVRQ